MAIVDMSNSRQIRIWGFALLAFGVIILTLLDDSVPERSNLEGIAGELRSLEKITSKGGGLSSVRFSLSADPRHFSYHSTAGDIDHVWSALNQAGLAEVGVLIDPADPYSPPFDDRSYYAVLEVKVGGEAIRPYSQVVDSLRSNHFTGVTLGYGTVAIGIALLVTAFLKRQLHAQ